MALKVRNTKIFMVVLGLGLINLVFPLSTFTPYFWPDTILRYALFVSYIFIVRQIRPIGFGRILYNTGAFGLILAIFLKIMHLQGADLILIAGAIVFLSAFVWDFFGKNVYSLTTLSYFICTISFLYTLVVRMMKLPWSTNGFAAISLIAGILYLSTQLRATTTT